MHVGGNTQFPEQYTIADLIYYAQTQPQSEISAKSVESYASTLRSFAKKVGQGEDGPAEYLLTNKFDNHLAQLKSKSDKSRLRKWQQLYQRLISKEKQDSFGGVLTAAMERRGITITELGKKVGVPRTRFYGWLSGQYLPRELSKVKLVEKELGLQAGTLTRLVAAKTFREPHKMIPMSWWPPKWKAHGTDATERKMVTIYFLGQENLILPEKELKPLFDIALQKVIDGHHLTEWRVRQVELQRLRYRLNISKWPSGLKRQWQEVVTYMTSSGSFTNKHRNSRWREATAFKKTEFLSAYFGFLTLSKDAEDVRMRGLGIAVEDLNFAHLLDENNFIAFAEFMKSRSGAYPTSLKDDIALIKLLTREDSGYFYTFPEKIPNALTFLDKTPREKRKQLKKLHEALSEHEKSLRGWTEQLRETFEIILPILDEQRPRDRVLEAIEEYGQDVMRQYPYTPGQVPSRAAAIQWRNYLLLHMLIRFPLRCSHWPKMTYLKDNKGHFFYDKSNTLCLRLPYSEFKNESNQTYFASKGIAGRKREVVLSFGSDSPLGEVKELAEIYLSHFHSVLVGENGGYVFCSKDGDSVTEDDISEVVRHWSLRYVSMFGYKKTCIENVYPFSTHAFRHIVATDAVKNEGVEAAAALLLDSPQQILKNYARFVPEDAINRAFRSKAIFRPGHVVVIRKTPKKAKE